MARKNNLDNLSCQELTREKPHLVSTPLEKTARAVIDVMYIKKKEVKEVKTVGGE